MGIKKNWLQPGAQEVTLSLCLSVCLCVTFMNSSLNSPVYLQDLFYVCSLGVTKTCTVKIIPSVHFLFLWEYTRKYYTTFVGVLQQKWYWSTPTHALRVVEMTSGS